MSASKKTAGHLFALFTIVVWGSCYVLTKNMLNAGFTAIQITPIRMALAYLALLVMRPRFLRLPLKDELMFVLIGIAGGSFYFFLQNTALTRTYAANVSIIVSLSPSSRSCWRSCSAAGTKSLASSSTSAPWWPSPALCWWCSTAVSIST